MIVVISMPWIWNEISTIRFIDLGTKSIENCTVTKVYDGDTATAICNGEKTRIRFNCIDTPEMKQGHWGRMSRDYLRDLIPLKSTVRLDKKEKDKYGRLVADVYHDGRNINLLMVQSGHANVYRKYCSDDRFIQAAKEARSARVGIWKMPGLHQTPWLWRRNNK